MDFLIVLTITVVTVVILLQNKGDQSYKTTFKLFRRKMALNSTLFHSPPVPINVTNVESRQLLFVAIGQSYIF